MPDSQPIRGASTALLPVMPLRDVVVYPHVIKPLLVGRPLSIAALRACLEADKGKRVVLVAQRQADVEDPGAEDLYDVGTLAVVLQQRSRLQDGVIKVLVEGLSRVAVDEYDTVDGCLRARHRPLEETAVTEPVLVTSLRSSVLEAFSKLIKARQIPEDTARVVGGIDDLGRLVDTVADHLGGVDAAEHRECQTLLEMTDVNERAHQLLSLIATRLDAVRMEKKIQGQVRRQMEKSHREYYLNEQIKAIQRELDQSDEGGENKSATDALQEKIEEAGMPDEAKDKCQVELRKLKMMSPMSAEASVVRGYLDWVVSVPWKKRSRLRSNIKQAEACLDADHYGLKDVKERILEHLAVQRRVRKMRGPILCLVGPPGVGKTSLGESIARATQRRFIRMSLGGVRDEAEIRGHRRTYIGSLPGRVIQKMVKAGVKNPLFLFDEIDKIGMDWRGDPASAMLEVLDPQQNSRFGDHYLEVDYDLSETMFLCTANTMDVPPALLDRMDIVRLPGYTEDEKFAIARRHLWPSQTKQHGLKDAEIALPDETVYELIRSYSREAGVRQLDRLLAQLCRKVVKQLAVDSSLKKMALLPETLVEHLGARKYRYGLAQERCQVGHVNGLGWSPTGGDLLDIEALAVHGRGRHVRTGSLGDVMQESIKAAFAVVRKRAQALGIQANFFERYDFHVHVPEGATPKDGPSAGIAMCTALVSALTGVATHADLAMTGEITLHGRVLPIGGLKEKLLAAHRGGIKTVVIPAENEKDLRDVPERIREDLDIRTVSWIDEVFPLALDKPLQPLSDEDYLRDYPLRPFLAYAEDDDAKGDRAQAH